ncbi:MAG: hypothetical protein HYR91_12455 [Flavobacteriia bacterium]|nr:hypothetical protein [Flavobacteriia bacterium]
MKQYYLFFYFLIFSFIGLSQESEGIKNPKTVERTKSSEKEAYNLLLAELDGTFQFRVNDEGKSILLSTPLLERIKNSREFVNAVYLELEEGIVIFIPSKTEIQSSSFVKLEKVVYQSNILNNEDK